MVQFGDVLVLGVLSLVAVRLAGAVRLSFSARSYVRDIVRGVRASHVLLAIPAIVLVIVVASLLMSVPGLDLGWWTAIGGEGNPALGMTSATNGSVLDVVVPFVFLAMVVLALPLLVSSEERLFRRGAEHRSWRANVGWALLFGLAHAVVGIPIGAALALSIGGLYFTGWYLHAWRRSGSQPAALMASSRAHLAYNAAILTLVAVALLAGW